MQSTLQIAPRLVPAHVAVIMDGNGRWATRRGRPRSAGHLAGARATRRVIEAAARAGIGTLTLYAFSADNWARPATEVTMLMRLFARYLAAERARCAREGVRLQVVGRRDRLDPKLRAAVEATEAATRPGRRLRVRLAIDYSARDAIVDAARDASVRGASRDGPDPRAAFGAAVARAMHDDDPPGDVDLLVRAGGELRLSDFLLWECAYAELWFTDVLWPDFGPRDFDLALAAFGARQRRFGALPTPVAGALRSCA